VDELPTETAETRACAEAWLAELDAEALERLRVRWPLGGGGDGPADLLVLEGMARSP
jgi:hypothetical protein